MPPSLDGRYKQRIPSLTHSQTFALPTIAPTQNSCPPQIQPKNRSLRSPLTYPRLKDDLSTGSRSPTALRCSYFSRLRWRKARIRTLSIPLPDHGLSIAQSVPPLPPVGEVASRGRGIQNCSLDRSSSKLRRSLAHHPGTQRALRQIWCWELNTVSPGLLMQ